jgi:hypothetical protein
MSDLAQAARPVSAWLAALLLLSGCGLWTQIDEAQATVRGQLADHAWVATLREDGPPGSLCLNIRYPEDGPTYGACPSGVNSFGTASGSVPVPYTFAYGTTQENAVRVAVWLDDGRRLEDATVAVPAHLQRAMRFFIIPIAELVHVRRVEAFDARGNMVSDSGDFPPPP